jgi:hypothetical protein
LLLLDSKAALGMVWFRLPERVASDRDMLSWYFMSRSTLAMFIFPSRRP